MRACLHDHVCIRYPGLRTCRPVLSNETCAKLAGGLASTEHLGCPVDRSIAAGLVVSLHGPWGTGPWHKELDELDVSWEMES